MCQSHCLEFRDANPRSLYAAASASQDVPTARILAEGVAEREMRESVARKVSEMMGGRLTCLWTVPPQARLTPPYSSKAASDRPLQSNLDCMQFKRLRKLLLLILNPALLFPGIPATPKGDDHPFTS